MTTQRGIVVALPLLLLIGAMYWHIGGHALVYSQPAAEERAAELVAQERPPETCWNIHTIIPTYPPLASFQATCIRQYAEIKKDPAACELLMPNNYGWSCLGGAMEHQPCLFDFSSPPKVQGNGLNIPMSECNEGNSSVRNNECCIIAREVHLGGNNSCSTLDLQPSFKDQCFHEFAIRNKDIVACSTIQNENIRIGCEVGVRALIKRDAP